MFARKLLVDRLTRWSKLIEDPQGFPENPSHDHCWIWTGTHTKARTYSTMVNRAPDKPLALEVRRSQDETRASFLGQPASPHRVMLAFHHDLDLHEIGRVRSTCGSRSCINPLHWSKVGNAQSERMKRLPDVEPEPQPEPEPEPEPEQDPRDRAFKLFYLNSVTMDDPPEMLPKRGIYNPDFAQYLVEYQLLFGEKTQAELAEIFA